MPSVEDLKRQLAEAEEAERRERQLTTQTNIPTFQTEQQPKNRYAATSWAAGEYDFRVPSGQLCRLKSLELDKVAETGILDRVTRLPGVVGEVIAKSEGQPPKAEAEMPDADTIKTVVEVCNIITPMVVVAPQIWPLPAEGETRKPDRIYVDSIDIVDRIAIMNRALGGLAKLDSFRPQS